MKGIPKEAMLSAALLAISLTACQSRQDTVVAATEPIVEEIQETQSTEAATIPTRFWDDVVELENGAGESTTVYLLQDGRYLDRADRFFTFDGIETWTGADGTQWKRKADSTLATTNVYAEFAIDRLLTQRPDHLFFSDAADSSTASKIVLTFDTTVTNFCFLKLNDAQVDENGNFTCTDMQELYTQDVITENDLMVVETDLGEVIPTKGIRFNDASGNRQFYYLTVSGKDNVPLLVPFG